MAFNLGDIIVTIKSKTDDLKKGIHEIDNLVDKAHNGTGKLTKMTHELDKIGKAAVVGLGAAGVAVGAFGALSVKAFMESENVMAQTEAVIKSTGQAAGLTKDEVAGLASSLQSVTKFSDETIQSGENLLLTFTSIGKDIFPQATETMLDMSQALGQDTKSSAVQLGKALQDPILGVTALRRVGVNFSDAQQEVIKNLVETGKKAEAQKFILKELQTEFGGSARAAGETFSGKLEILKNKFGDVQETIGKTLVEKLTPFAEKLAEIVSSKDFENFLNGAVNALVTFFGIVGDVVGVLIQMGQWLAEHPVLLAILAGIIGTILVAAFVSWAISATAAAIATLAALWPIIAIGAAIGALAYLIITHWDTIKKAFSAAVQWIKEHWDLLLTIILGPFGFIIAQVIKHADDIKRIVGGVVNSVIGFFKSIPGAVGNMINSVVGWFQSLGGRISGAVGGIVNIVTSPFKSAFNGIARLWNNSIGKLSFKAPDWVPGIGGKGFSMPTLPYLAGGTDNFRGGWAVVGERGPELVNLPSGSRVVPNSESGGMMGSHLEIHGDVNIDSEQDADYLLNKFDRNMQLERMGLSPT